MDRTTLLAFLLRRRLMSYSVAFSGVGVDEFGDASAK
jgi:hypothetical protein